MTLKQGHSVLRRLIAPAALLFVLATPVFAVPIVSGVVPGADGDVDIGMIFGNDLASTVDILSIVIDGSSTAVTGGILLWESVFGTVDPPGAVSSVLGLGTSVLTYSFVGSFGPGEIFSFGVDPDIPGDPAFGAIVSDLIGTTVLFTFSDSSNLSGVFVDDPAPGAGLVLEVAAAPVPEPASLLTLGAGLGMLALRAVRRRS